jgi:hypothetical protein
VGALNDESQFGRLPQNQPELYSFHPDFQDAGVQETETILTSPDLFSLSAFEKTHLAASVSEYDLRHHAQSLYKGHLTTLSRPDSPTRRHELRHYAPVPFLPASDVVQRLVSDKSKNFNGRDVEVDDPKKWKDDRTGGHMVIRQSGHSASKRLKRRVDLDKEAKAISPAPEAAKGSVTVSGIGARSRMLYEDDYGGVHTVWRTVNKSVADRKVGAPSSPFFSRSQQEFKQTPKKQAVMQNMRSAKQLTATSLPYRKKTDAGDESRESPRFGKQTPRAKQPPRDSSLSAPATSSRGSPSPITITPVKQSVVAMA